MFAAGLYLLVNGLVVLGGYNGNQVTGTHFRFSVLDAPPTASMRGATLPHPLLPHTLQRTRQHALQLATTQTEHDGTHTLSHTHTHKWDMHIKPDHTTRDASAQGERGGSNDQLYTGYDWGHVGLTLDGCGIDMLLASTRREGDHLYFVFPEPVTTNGFFLAVAAGEATSERERQRGKDGEKLPSSDAVAVEFAAVPLRFSFSTRDASDSFVKWQPFASQACVWDMGDNTKCMGVHRAWVPQDREGVPDTDGSVVRFFFDERMQSYQIPSTLFANIISGSFMMVGSILCIFVHKRNLLRIFLSLSFGSHGVLRVLAALGFAFSNSGARVDESYFWFASGIPGLIRGIICCWYEQYFIQSIPYLFVPHMIGLGLHNHYILTPALASRASLWIPVSQFLMVIAWALARMLRRWNLKRSASAIQPHLLSFNSIWARLQSDAVEQPAIKRLEQICSFMHNPYLYSQTSCLESCWHTFESCLRSAWDGRRPVSTQVSQVTLPHGHTSVFAHSAHLVGQEQFSNVAGAHEPKSKTAGALVSLDMLYTQALLMHVQLLVIFNFYLYLYISLFTSCIYMPPHAVYTSTCAATGDFLFLFLFSL